MSSELDEVTDWARAIVLGIRDTARDAMDAARREAHEAYNEGWRRYEEKVKRDTGRQR